jgi:hypothetical protein
VSTRCCRFRTVLENVTDQPAKKESACRL